MRTRKIIRTAAASVAILLALVWGAWLIAVPGSLIKGKIGASLEGSPVTVEFEGFRKGLFYSIRADGLSISRAGGGTGLLYLEDLRAGLSIPSLFSLSPSIEFSATLAGGRITGSAGTGGVLIMKAEDVDLSALGLERSITGLRAGGKAWLEANAADGSGEVRFRVTGIEFLPYRYMGFSLPLDLLKKARGLVLIENGMVRVESATFEGEGIYARIKGSAGGGRVDMRLELMPSAELENSQPYFRLLQQYRVTSGRYEIPIKTSY